ncbi:MAG: O-antigen ligase family protein [Clostridia bacterium]|nr:O-antigen ligase family protein [Clostridia bacterium]
MQASIPAKQPIVRAIVRFQQSVWYPVVYALLCAISGLFGKQVYLPVALVASVLIIFSTLFADDLKVLLSPFFMSMFLIGIDFPEQMAAPRENPLGVFDPQAFRLIVVIGVIDLIFVCLRLCREGLFRELSRKPHFLYGILALNAAYLLAGLLSPKWTPTSLLSGVLFALGLTVCYAVFSHIIHHSRSPYAYACLCMALSALVVLAQTATVIYRLHAAGELVLFDPTEQQAAFNHYKIQLAWGYSTNIAGMMILGIPAAVYLAKNCRFSLLSYLLALALLLGAVATGTRTATLVGSAILLVCLALACIKGRNAKWMRYYTLITLLLATVAILYVDRYVVSFREQILPAVLNHLRLTDGALSGLSSRLSLWKNGIADFLESPVFGVGFADGGYTEELAYSNVVNDMYHNVVVQFLGAMGVVGALAFLWHLKDLVTALIRRPSIDRTVLLAIAISVLAASMADNFFFYFNFQIFYATSLALAERHLRDTPPRSTTSEEKS